MLPAKAFDVKTTDGSHWTAGTEENEEERRYSVTTLLLLQDRSFNTGLRQV